MAGGASRNDVAIAKALTADRSLASAPNTIEVVKISIPRGLFLIAIS